MGLLFLLHSCQVLQDPWVKRGHKNANRRSNEVASAGQGDSYSASGRDGVGSYKSKSEYVLAVLEIQRKMENQLKLELSSRLTARQIPIPLRFVCEFLCQFCAISAPGRKIRAFLSTCPESLSVQGSTLDPPDGISENQTPNVNQDQVFVLKAETIVSRPLLIF